MYLEGDIELLSFVYIVCRNEESESFCKPYSMDPTAWYTCAKQIHKRCHTHYHTGKETCRFYNIHEKCAKQCQICKGRYNYNNVAVNAW